MIARGSYPYAASHIIGHTDNAMTKIALTSTTNQFALNVPRRLPLTKD